MNRKFVKMMAVGMFVTAVAGTLLWTGCTEKDDDPIDDGYDPVPKATEEYYGEDLERQSENNPEFAAAGRPVTDKSTYDSYLGYGYNVLEGSYYNSREVKQMVLNISKLIDDSKIYEDVNGTRVGKTYTAVGTDVSSYSEKFSSEVQASTKGLFSGSIKVDFGISTSTTASKSFGKTWVELTKVTHHLNLVSESALRDTYLDPTFAKELLDSKNTPADLFTVYGTHIMLKVRLGGRLEMSYLIENSTREDKTTLEANVKASYGAVSGEATANYETVRNWAKSNTEEKIVAEGGNILGLDMTTYDNAKKNFTAWSQSLETTNYISLINGGAINNNAEMVPIWKLVDSSKNSARYNAIKKEFEDQLKNKGTWLAGLQPVLPAYVKQMYVGAGSTWDNGIADLKAKTAEELFIIGVDLNKGAGGDYIFFGYTRTSDSTKAITMPGIRVQGDEAPPKSYTWQGNTFNIVSYTDLNKGCKSGKDIYLYETRGKESNYKPVIDLFVSIDGDLSGRLGSTGWYREGDDLNRGAGGRDIYLWFRRNL